MMSRAPRPWISTLPAPDPRYGFLAASGTSAAWKRLGVRRRAGIMIPLFAFRSSASVGVGEFPDLAKLGVWASEAGLSLIQLLPLNDVGGRFCPYDAESSMALEPMHLSLTDLSGVRASDYRQDIAAMKKRFSGDPLLLDPAIKPAKILLLRKMYQALGDGKNRSLDLFRQKNRHWLEDYALYRALKGAYGQRAWEDWPVPLRDREPQALKQAASYHADEIRFQCWLQFQAFSQLSAAAAALRKTDVRLVGDLPFLVARDSADVWMRRQAFKLDLSAGAPPDLYFEDGQEWGMPPYDWAHLSESGHSYLRERLGYAGQFYDLYRIDHFVGLLRVWAFPRHGQDRKKQAFFDPPEESKWEPQARMILEAMTDSTKMLPCAEDLGTVPDVARDLLVEFGIPGMEVQRWTRDWHGTKDFLRPEVFRANAIATLSTHDMGPFCQWWKEEATQDDRSRFERWAGLSDPGEAEALRAALESTMHSSSIFCIHSFQDWLTLAGLFKGEDRYARVNRPGIVDDVNWRLRVPETVESWRKLPATRQIRKMSLESGRIC